MIFVQLLADFRFYQSIPLLRQSFIFSIYIYIKIYIDVLYTYDIKKNINIYYNYFKLHTVYNTFKSDGGFSFTIWYAENCSRTKH